MSQLEELAQPFAGHLVKQAPSGKHGQYVAHSTITERLLSVVGPFSFAVTEIVRGDAPAIKTANNEWPAREDAVVGCLATLSCDVDGVWTQITEVGSEDNPAMSNDAENLKNATSDALKRCAMRMGLGLHLWSQQDYFLAAQFAKDHTETEGEDEGLPAADGEDAVEPEEGRDVPSSPPPAPAQTNEALDSLSEGPIGDPLDGWRLAPDDPGEAWTALMAHLETHPDVRTLKDDIHAWVKELYALMVATQLWPEDALQAALERDYPDMELWKGERHVGTLLKDKMLQFADRSFLWAKQKIAQEQVAEAVTESWPEEEGTDESEQ